MKRPDTDRVRESELALVPAVEVHTWLDGNITRHPETHFLDFVVDGRSIREMVDGGPGHVTEPSCADPGCTRSQSRWTAFLVVSARTACRRTGSRSWSAE